MVKKKQRYAIMTGINQNLDILDNMAGGEMYVLGGAVPVGVHG
jgi:hypothetical protein